jgi:hypothetical protein
VVVPHATVEVVTAAPAFIKRGVPLEPSSAIFPACLKIF